MSFSKRPELGGTSMGIDRILNSLEPTRKFAIPSLGDIKEARAGYIRQPVEISDLARYRLGSWGVDPRALDEIAVLCDELYYNRPEMHAAEILSKPLSISPSYYLADLVFDNAYDWDANNPYGECSELKTRLYKKIAEHKILEKYGLDRPHLTMSGMSGHADKFFNYGISNHSWIGIHQFLDFAFEDFNNAVIIDPSLRVIKGLLESGYQLGTEVVHREQVKKVYPIEEDDDKDIRVHMALNRINLGLMTKNGSSTIISAPEHRGVIRSDMILGSTHDYKYVVALGLANSVERAFSYEWYLNIIDKNSEGVAQVFLERKTSESPITGILVTPLHPDFKATQFGKKTLTQLYLTLIAGENARKGLPHFSTVGISRF